VNLTIVQDFRPYGESATNLGLPVSSRCRIQLRLHRVYSQRSTSSIGSLGAFPVKPVGLIKDFIGETAD